MNNNALKETRKNELLKVINENKKLIEELRSQMLELELQNKICNDELVIINTEEPEPVNQDENEVQIEEGLTFEDAKTLTHTELSMKDMFNSKNTQIELTEVEVGDVIELYSKKWNGVKTVKITKRTAHNLFYEPIMMKDFNLVQKYDFKTPLGHLQTTIYYYFVKINSIYYTNTNEASKIVIKKNSKVTKALENFIIVKETDWGA